MATVVKEEKKNPKRMQRDARKQTLDAGIGTKSQQALKLQQEIDSMDIQISNMKKYLSSIVREYKFDSVQAFRKELNAAKTEYLNYKAALSEWEKAYGEKAADSMSLKDRLTGITAYKRRPL